MSNLETIKKKLILRKEELENGLSRLYKEKVSEDIVQDTADQALTSSLEDIKISLHNTELDEYKMILKALDMIEKGTYGICVDCGKPISEKRLLLFPNSTRCLICQEALEERESA
ncbi:TraR/DksA family transcriptional regulator [Candidatus Babela massiliensis]|uniref:DnaK suppressor protein n=1 Tax=Candidatus Babela massiliensis TaxID=673862 RepID=V6DIE6_9BACT|nr:TraR/DksA C4-type zinc finger protein [Candidatus Babela massiliensis]CDK30301.1 DnaK suppressor protein [Candidatus Babela massiliensis]